MRACEGCRRRKIKCDAATTNTWPCSACIRLKLHCVPPTVNYDRDFSTNQGFEGERVEYESGGSGDDDYQHQLAMQQQMGGPHKNIPPIYTHQMPYQDTTGVYHPGSYGEPSSSHSQPSMHYSNMQTPVSVVDQHQNYPPQPGYSSVPIPRQPSHPQTPEAYEQDQYGQQNLADLLGELRMNEAGSGMRIPRITRSSRDERRLIASSSLSE